MKIASAIFTRSVVGGLLLLLAILSAVLDPMHSIAKYTLRVYEGSNVYMAFENPDYIIHHSVYLFNYTNTERYLQGLDAKLKVEEVGPFVYSEITKSANMSVDHVQKVLRFTPNSSMVFVPELSAGRTQDLRVIAPNLVMIVLGTLAADKLPSWSNSPVAVLMRSVNAKLFINVTVEELLWGYPDTLVDLASTYFPGWIDFNSVGVMKMFYSSKPKQFELESEGENMFAIRNMDGSPGLKEQGFDGPGTANICNTLRGTYQGMLLSPDYPREKILGLFRYQGCRVYPFVFEKDGISDFGVPFNRYVPHVESFNASGPYACKCGTICPPHGLVDISGCYYGFPAYISPAIFYGADPSLLEPFEGLVQDEEKARTYMDFDKTTGVPLHVQMTQQTSIRVHVSPYNSEMKPLARVGYLPITYIRVSTPYGPSPKTITNLRLLYVHFPRIFAATQVILIVLGGWLITLNLLILSRSRTFEKRKEEKMRAEENSTEPLNLDIKR